MTVKEVCSLLQTIDCDLVIFLFKLAETLLDTSVRPFIATAVCNDMFDSYRDNDDHDGQYNVNNGVSYTQRSYGNLSIAVCSRSEQLPSELAEEIQRHAAGVLVAYRMLTTVPAVFLGLFCGAWSDTRGRKLPMMVPSGGSCVAVVLFLISTQVPGSKVALLLAGAATQGFFGKSPVISMAVNSHVSDNSHTDERTRRLGRLLASSFLGMFLGSFLAGILQDMSSLRTTFVVVSACHATCVLVVLLCVREVVVSEDENCDDSSSATCRLSDSEATRSSYSEGEEEEEEEVSEEERRIGGRRKVKKEYSLFSLAGLMESVLTVVKKREGHTRCVILISLTCLTTNQMLKVGDQDVTTLFVQRPPLSWPSSLYGYLVAVDSGAVGLALLIVLPVLTNVLHVSDTRMVLVAIAFRLVRALWAGFCTQTWMMFTSVAFGAAGGLLVAALRSELSKAAHPGEVGKLFSIQGSLETLSKLLGSSIFTGIYAATAHLLPAAAYLSEVVVYLFMALLLLWLRQILKEEETHGLVPSVSKTYHSMKKVDENLNGQLLSSIRRLEKEENGATMNGKGETVFVLGASTP